MIHNNPFYTGYENQSVYANFKLFVRYITEEKKAKDRAAWTAWPLTC